EILKFDSPDVVTDLDSTRGLGHVRYRSSEKRFVVPLKDFERIIQYREAGVKLITRRGYLEGRLTDDPGAALPGLRDFRAALPISPLPRPPSSARRARAFLRRSVALFPVKLKHA